LVPVRIVGGMIDHLRQDLLSAVRNVRKYPVACLVAVLSLAGGLGAMTATLTVRNVLFRNPPPLYHDPGQLSHLQVGSPQQPIRGGLGNAVPAALFRIWQDSVSGGQFAGATNRRTLDVRAGDQTVTRPVRAVTPELFAVLGVAPAIGRVGTAGDAAAAPAVLSYNVWQVLFGGRPDAIGAPLWIDNKPYTVVAAMPDRFWFVSMDSPIWTPVAAGTFHADEPLDVIVRRSDGVTPQALDAQLRRGLESYTNQLPAADRTRNLRISGIEGTPAGMSMALVLPYLIAVCVMLTLLIACANVAILMIAQWTGREHEIAIRASLGAGRGRLVRSLVAESLLIAGIGGVLGIATTFALIGVIRRNAGPMVAMFDLSIDPAVLLQSALLTILTGVAAGVAPALYETRRLNTNPLNALRASDRVRQRWRHTLVVFEIAVTVALLVVATMGVDGYRRTGAADMGFPTQPFMQVTVQNLDGVAIQPVMDALSQLPGVASVAASTMVPTAANGTAARLATDAAGSDAIAAQRGLISPGFFETLGVPMRAGRSFTAADTPETRTAIVNETLATRLFGSRNAIGERAWIGSDAYEVIGVVADYAANPFQQREGQPRMFVPIAPPADLTRVTYLVRAATDPAPLVETARRAVPAAVTGHSVTSAFTFNQIITIGSQEMLVGFAPLFPLIAIGMLLTAAGIYGVLAFAITRRSKELAVRVAMGATGRDLVRLVGLQSLRLIMTGLVLGLGGMLGLRQLVRSGGGAGSSFDPHWPAFAIPMIIVIVIGAIATWMPSRRVVTIDPAIELRN
jgi:predicted permease